MVQKLIRNSRPAPAKPTLRTSSAALPRWMGGVLLLNPLAAALVHAQSAQLCAIPDKPWSCERIDERWECAGRWQTESSDSSQTESAGLGILAADAERVESADGENFAFIGEVLLTRDAQSLRAPRVNYLKSEEKASAEGPVRLDTPTLIAYAKRIDADLASERSELRDVRYALKDGRGNGEARYVMHQGPESMMKGVSFSSCPEDLPAWKIRASQVRIDHEKKIGTAKDFKVVVGGVPVFYWPFATFPLSEARKSGFLAPTIGVSDGFDFSLPYYFNLAPNYDLTLTPRNIQQRGFILGADFRYLDHVNTGNIRGTFMPDDDKRTLPGDEQRYSWNVDWSSRFNNNFDFIASLNRVSDDFYFEDLGDSLTTNATSVIASQAGIYGRGVWGSFQEQYGTWQTGISADRFEIIDPANPGSLNPYRRAPRLFFNADQNYRGFTLGARSELVSFRRSEGVEGERLDLEPYLRYQWRNSYAFFRPEVSFRHTRYELDDDRSLKRSLPIASLDAGLYFDRASAWFAPNLRQTLEPRLYYLRAPYRDQAELPSFDTTELDFSLPQLFRSNRFSGADRQADANQIAVAVTSRWIDDQNGSERARLSLGQIRYFEDSLVTLPNVAPFTSSAGVWVAEAQAALGKNWRATVAHQYDPEISRTRLSAARLQRSLGDRGLINFGYRYRFNRDLPLEQVDVSGLAPINERWSLIGRVNYSLPESRTLEALAGFEYKSCCWRLRLIGRHYVRAGTLEGRNVLLFELELNGLGVLGRKTDRLLQNAIFGFSDLATDSN